MSGLYLILDAAPFDSLAYDYAGPPHVAVGYFHPAPGLGAARYRLATTSALPTTVTVSSGRVYCSSYSNRHGVMVHDVLMGVDDTTTAAIHAFQDTDPVFRERGDALRRASHVPHSYHASATAAAECMERVKAALNAAGGSVTAPIRRVTTRSPPAPQYAWRS